MPGVASSIESELAVYVEYKVFDTIGLRLNYLAVVLQSLTLRYRVTRPADRRRLLCLSNQVLDRAVLTWLLYGKCRALVEVLLLQEVTVLLFYQLSNLVEVRVDILNLKLRVSHYH